jgi:hypothetical protein
MVALDAPFTYNNRENLIVDWHSHANGNGNQAFAYYMDYAAANSPVAEFGMACRTSGNLTPRCFFSPSVVGGSCTVNLQNSSGSSPTSLLLGVTRQPNSIPLDAIGMPGCFLHVETFLSVATVTSASGSASNSFPIPNELFYIRRSLVAQHVSADLFANNLGLITSNGAHVTLGVNPLLTVVVATGSTTATTGTVYRDNGSVSVFEYQ